MAKRKPTIRPLPEQLSSQLVVLQALTKGSNFYGYECANKKGTRVYVALRRYSEVFRDGLSSISEAIVTNRAKWAVDEQTIHRMKNRGVSVVMVYQYDPVKKARIYTTSIDNFLQHGVVANYEKKGGSRQYYLPFGFFAHREIQV